MRRGEGLVLEVYDSFWRIEEVFASPRQAVILGMNDDARPVTLLEVHPGGGTSGGGEDLPTLHRFLPLQALVGVHFQSPAEVSFEALACNFTHLADWLQPQVFKSSGVLYPGESSRAEATYEAPDLLTLPIPCDQAELTIESGFQQSTKQGRSLSWLHHTSLTITPTASRAAKWFWERVFHFRHLLALATHRRVYPLRLRARVRTEADDRCRSVPVHAHWHFKTGAPAIEPASPWPHLLIPFEPARMQDLIPAWFELREPLRSPLGAYLGERYADGLYIELQMMSLMRAFEGLFHKQPEREARYIGPSAFEKLAKQIRDDVPDGLDQELVESLRGAIGGANRWVLEKCLREEIASWSGTKLEGYFPDPAGFAETAKRLRNRLAHGADLGTVDAYADDMVNAVERLRVLVTAMLLHRVGIERATVAERIATHPNMYHLRAR